MSDKISVIIRSRNEDRWIGHTIQSVLDFIYKPEIIIVDNGSDNETINYLKDSHFPLVIKADGLASGKGVYICETKKQGVNAVHEIFNGKFKSSKKVVLEEFLRGEDGVLKGIKTVEVDSNFQEIPGTEKDWEADLILLAMGFLGPEHYAIDNLKVDLDERSNYKADHNVHQTSNPKVFAAGDCRRGQSLVVWAINEGRAAAREIDQYLMGETVLK